MKDWENARIEPIFFREGVSCYKLTEVPYKNEYYIVSEAETRRLMNSPEVVGYEVYRCLLCSTCQMLRYLKEQGRISSANILSILRGALNYPIEESCFREQILVHDISFLSSERVFTGDGALNGLEVKYNKLTAVPDSSLLIGDIIASGDTLVNSLKHVLGFYRERGMKLRNILFFTIGGLQGVEVLEELAGEIRSFWPDFEGFVTVYYEGIFNCYLPGDRGVSGINRALIDFYWKNGIISPEFRRQTLSKRDPLFEKCTIYDGGARRYEISVHREEVLEFWNGIRERADSIDKTALLEEKLGHSVDADYETWLRDTHYQKLDEESNRRLFRQEKDYIESLRDVTLREIAETRIAEFTAAMKPYR